MIRERIGSLVLRAYPRETRLALGPEMLSMLLDASEGSTLTFIRECCGLVVGGIRERAAFMRTGPNRTRALAAVVVMMIVAGGAIIASDELSGSPNDATNIPALAAATAPHMRSGDLVLVAWPEQISLAAHYLPVGLRYFTPTRPQGFAKLPNRDRQAYARHPGSHPRAALSRLLTRLAPGQHVLFIRPLNEGNADWSNRSTRLVRRHGAQWGAVLAQDRELRVLSYAPHGYSGSCCIEDSAVLYVKS